MVGGATEEPLLIDVLSVTMGKADITRSLSDGMGWRGHLGGGGGGSWAGTEGVLCVCRKWEKDGTEQRDHIRGIRKRYRV